jgi:hypothetical protein
MAALTREELEAIIPEDPKGLPDRWDMANPFIHWAVYIPPEQGFGLNAIWDDLRPTEDEALMNELDTVYEVAEREMARVEKLCREATIEACLRFAAAHPDAPRSRRAVAA